MVSLVASDIQNFTAPAGYLGLFGIIGHFTNSPVDNTPFNHNLSCNGIPSASGATALPRNQANGTFAITSFACPTPAIGNFTMWLTNSSYNGTILSIVSRNITFEDCLSGVLTKGCASIVAPTQIYLPGNESDANISFPVEVNCGTANTTDYVLIIGLNSNIKSCRTDISFRSCAVRSFNVTYTMRAADNCTGVVGTQGSVVLQYFTPGDYAHATSNNGYGLESWASFRRYYSFRVSGQFVTKGIIPGTSTIAAIRNVSVVTPPSLLPAGLSGALILEINDPKTPLSSGVIAAVDVKLDNGTDFKVHNLSVPLEVTFPLVPPTPCKDNVCHYWDVPTNTWSTEGCETLQSSAGEWICSCTHATDFSILLIDSPSCAAELAPTLEPFYAYSCLYILLGMFAFYSAAKVIALRSGHCGIIMEHLGVVAICGIRTFLSLFQLGVSGPVTAVALTTISAVPRLLEFAVFSFIIATWGALLHFSMGTSNPYRKARPYFIGVNVFAAAIVCYVFIAFAVAPSYDAAIVGEALLGFNSLLLSVGFMVYATWLHKQFGKAGGTSTTTGRSNGCCNSLNKVVYLGWLLSFSFVAQSVFACLALSAIPRNGTAFVDVTEARFFIDLYNGLYRMFNIITLGCIIALYWDGIRKIVAKESQAHSQHSSTRPSTFAQSVS